MVLFKVIEEHGMEWYISLDRERIQKHTKPAIIFWILGSFHILDGDYFVQHYHQHINDSTTYTHTHTQFIWAPNNINAMIIMCTPPIAHYHFIRPYFLWSRNIIEKWHCVLAIFVEIFMCDFRRLAKNPVVLVLKHHVDGHTYIYILYINRKT